MNADMMKSLQGCNTCMATLNETMNTQNIRETLKEFAKNSDKMGLQSEMMND